MGVSIGCGRSHWSVDRSIEFTWLKMLEGIEIMCYTEREKVVCFGVATVATTVTGMVTAIALIDLLVLMGISNLGGQDG